MIAAASCVAAADAPALDALGEGDAAPAQPDTTIRAATSVVNRERRCIRPPPGSDCRRSSPARTGDVAGSVLGAFVAPPGSSGPDGTLSGGRLRPRRALRLSTPASAAPAP